MILNLKLLFSPFLNGDVSSILRSCFVRNCSYVTAFNFDC